jgi:hypothetical protein
VGGLSLEIVLSHRALAAREVWRLIRRSSSAWVDDATRCSIDGTRGTLADVAAAIESSGRDHFGVALEGGEITYGHVGRFEVSIARIAGLVADQADAERWLGPLLGAPVFQQARLFDGDYELWQNAEDPLEYEARGQSWARLATKPNGAPAPLAQLVIDVSANPGRRVLRQGCVEAVGSVMWLGPAFWPATGASKELVSRQEWLRCEEVGSGVLRIVAALQPFTTSDPADLAALQERLRALLYPPAPALLVPRR